MAGPSSSSGGGGIIINNTQNPTSNTSAPTSPGGTGTGGGGGGRERAAVISEILANLGTNSSTTTCGGQIHQQQLIGPPILRAVNSQASASIATGQISSPGIGSGQISGVANNASGIQFRGAMSDHISGQIKQEGLSQPPTPKAAVPAATAAENEEQQNLTSHQTLVPSKFFF